MSPKAKNWAIGIGCFFAGVIVTIIGFVVLTIYVSFIREKEDDEQEQEPVVSMVDEETMRMNEAFDVPMLASRRCEEIPLSSITVGSWWTDGDVYFKVLSNEGDTIYMVGTNLEDRGMEITLVKHDDYMRTYGSSVFAMYDSPALLRQITLADGSKTQVIVSYYDEDWMRPQSILQRYRGKGLEKQQVLP